MDPFNIVIRRNGRPLGLNIHPKDANDFMVLFEGMLVGELFLDGHGRAWGVVSARELFRDGLVAYRDATADCQGLLFDKQLVNRIGMEISSAVNLAH